MANVRTPSFQCITLPYLYNQVVGQLREGLVNYYTTIAGRFSAQAVGNNPDPLRLFEDVAIAHLIFKSLSKMGIWLWHRIDKQSAEDANADRTWVRIYPLGSKD